MINGKHCFPPSIDSPHPYGLSFPPSPILILTPPPPYVLFVKNIRYTRYFYREK